MARSERPQGLGRTREDDRQAPLTRFSLGVNYWPRGSALAMWHRFDPGEIGADFAQIADLGLDAVRFFLRWDEFQPQPGAPDSTMLARLETLLDLADANRLRVLPTLFCGYQGGVAFLPAWALDRRRPAGTVRTIVGEAPAPYGCADLYAGALLDEQLRFVDAVAERLRGRESIVAVDLGHRFADVRPPRRGKISTGDHGRVPAAEREVATWSARLSEPVHAAGAATTAGTHAEDLAQDRNVRLDSLCAPFAFASMQGTPLDVPAARGRLDAEALPFLAMLTAGFAHRPVLVTGLGTLFMREEERADYCSAVLERLHADGRLGAYWWCWSDCPDTFAPTPPFDEAPHELANGIVRADGTPKPVAAALSRFAREQRTVVAAREMPMISATYYYRTLPTSMETLYAAYLDFVRERRG